jgi:outer membrane protein assembly factor BamB
MEITYCRELMRRFVVLAGTVLILGACTGSATAPSPATPDFVDVPVVDDGFELPFHPSGPNDGRRSSLVALDAETGRIVWENEMPFGGWAYVLPVTGGVVFACGCQLGSVSVLAGVESSGAAQWMIRTDNWGVREVVADDDTMIAALTDGDDTTLAGIDATTGSVLWSIDSDVSTFGDLPGLAIVNRTVIVVEGDSTVRGLRARDGTELWRSEATESAGPPFVDGDRVLVPTNGGVSEVDMETGDMREVIAPPGADTDPRIGAVMVRSGALIGVRAYNAAEPRRHLIGVFDLDAGGAIWTRYLGERRHTVWGSEIVVSGPAFGSPGRILRSWDIATGKRLWRIDTKQRDAIPAQLVTAVGTTTFAVIEGHLGAIDASGSFVWSMKTPPDAAMVSIVDSTLIVPGPSDDCASPESTGEITALNPADGAVKWQTCMSYPVRYTSPGGPVEQAGQLVFFTGYTELAEA